MKKWAYLILCTSVLGLVASCGGQTSSLGGAQSSEPIDSSVVREKTLEEMLADLSTRKITYRTDYQIYSYPIGKESEKKIISHYEVETKFDEAAYETSAYLLSEEEKLLMVQFRYEKADDGAVTEKYVDLQNKVRSLPVLDANEETFQWEDSVYINQISKLTANKFTETEKNKFTYSVDDLSDIPLSIVHGAVPLTEFDLASFTVEVKDNQIDNLVFVEKEADDVYPDAMYGRTISVRLENIGTTSVAPTMANRVSAENDALGAALDEIKAAANYTTKLDLIVGEESENVQTMKVTSTDVVVTLGPTLGGTDSGVHTDGESLYVFEEKENQLVGTLVGESSLLVNLMPRFNFSKDIFTFAGETEGTRKYEVGMNYVDVLDDIYFLGEYAQDYAQTGGNITFCVKENHLSEVRFPTIVQDDTGAALLAYLSIQYSDINATTIDPTYWDTFVVEEKVLGEPLAWDAEEFAFDFVTDAAGTTEFMLPSLVFDLTLTDPTMVPTFIPSGTTYEVMGEYSIDDQCVYLDIIAMGAYTDEVCETINMTLTEAGYAYDDTDFAEQGIEYYDLGEVSIAIMDFEGNLVVSFILPGGEFTAA